MTTTHEEARLSTRRYAVPVASAAVAVAGTLGLIALFRY
jgi:hypothetical protein